MYGASSHRYFTSELFDRRWTGPGTWRLPAARPSNSDLTRGSCRLTRRGCVSTGGLRHLTRRSCIAPRRSGRLTGGSSNATRRSCDAIRESGSLTGGSAIVTGGSAHLTGGSSEGWAPAQQVRRLSGVVAFGRWRIGFVMPDRRSNTSRISLAFSPRRRGGRQGA